MTRAARPGTAARASPRVHADGGRAGAASTVGDDVLLAALLGPEGERGRRLAARLLETFGGLPGLAGAAAHRLTTVPGLGRALAGRVAAAFELGRRAGRPDLLRPAIGTPDDAAREVRDLIDERREVMVGLYLDAQTRLIARETIAVGSLNVARASPRDVLEPAVRLLAAGIVLAHNHPSGSPEPSEDDVRFTRGMGRGARLLGVALHDHVIVARGGFVSLRARGVTWDAPGGD